MKENLQKISLRLLLVLLLPINALLAQTNVPYWVETFTSPACNLTTTVPTSDIQGYFIGANSGTWWGKNVYRTTGISCVNNSADHVRFRAFSGGADGILVTPVVNLGIKELHFTRNRTNRSYQVQVTSDTSANGTNWSPVIFLPAYASTTTCIDTTILINSATAKRLRIIAPNSGGDVDIDSIWLTNYTSNLSPIASNVTVGTGGTYTSFTNTGGLFEAINNGVVNQNVTATVISNTNELGTHILNQFAAGYTLSIKPNSATLRTIEMVNPTRASDSLFVFNGADNVMIDGSFNGSGKYLLFRCANANIDSTGSVFALVNDARENSISNCIVESNAKRYNSAVIILGKTNLPWGNDGFSFYGNLVRESTGTNTGGYSNGFQSWSEYPVSTNQKNSRVTISKNQFTGFKGFSGSINIINLSYTGDSLIIDSNQFYKGSNYSFSSLQPISFITTDGGANATITNNSIGGSNPNRSGDPITYATQFIGIYTNTTDTGNTTLVRNNRISNIVDIGGNYVDLNPINIRGDKIIISDNVIGGLENPWDTLQGCGVMINAIPDGFTKSDTTFIFNNTVSNIKYIGKAAKSLTGISISKIVSNSPEVYICNNNVVSDMFSNSVAFAASTGSLSGINIKIPSNGSRDAFIYNNIVKNLSHKTDTNRYNVNHIAGFVNGIRIEGGASSNFNGRVFNNKIYNLTALNTNAADTGLFSSQINGITCYLNDGNSMVYNNQVSLAAANSSAVRYFGISCKGNNTNFQGNLRIVYNSVLLSGNSSSNGANGYSAAFNHELKQTIFVRNNIFMNARTGSNPNFAIVNDSMSANWTDTSCQHNLFVSSNNSQMGLWTNRTNPLDFAAWKASSNSDSASAYYTTTTLDPNLFFNDITTADLSIKSSLRNYVAAKGYPVNINTDWNSNTRSTTNPSIGAFEYTSISTAPTITSFLPAAANVGGTVTVKGTNFINVTKVWFGAAPAANFTTLNDSTITAVVPNNAYLGNIAVATTSGYTIGNKYFIVNNPQNAIIGNNDQNAVYYFKNGKLYGTKSYDYDNGNQYRNCPLEMASKGSLRGKTISQISNSGNHFIALASDNSVHAWGSNFRKELGDSSVNSRKSTSVDITNKGDLRGKTIIQILAGSYAGYALSSDGQVFSWGQDTLGVLGNGVSTNGIVWVPTSISSFGSLVGKTIIKLCKTTAANGYNNVFAIASDGTIHAWGGNPASSLGTGNSSVAEVPVNINQSGVLAGKTIVEIDGGINCTLLMDQDGLLYGMGNAGSIGVSGSIQANPVALDMLSGSSLFQKRALTILTGKRGSYGHVLDTSGALHAFGNNVFGNLGIGSTSNATRPVLVDATTSSITGKTIVGIANGDYCTYLLASDNTLHGFGSASSLMSGLTSPNLYKAISINTLMPPTTDATNLTVTSITQTTATISCTAGSGMGRLIVLKALSAIDTVSAINGIIYTSAAAQPGGSTVDGTGRVVYYNNGNTVNITGLTANRLYHVSVFEYDTFSSPCSYSVFKLGTPLSGSFTTGSAQSLASVVTAKPISISTTSATLGGNITADGGAAVTERGVVYATTANPTTANTKVTIGAGLGTFSQNITGLTSATTYHVRAYAINSVGTSYGADSTFTTISTPTVVPTVSTSKPTIIGVTNATLGGNVSDSGTATVTERGVVYSTSINPTTADTKAAIGTGLGTFSQMIVGLSATTTYHVRAYAINSVGTSYGADSTFTTSTGISLPVVITGAATAIANSSATLAGNVISDGGTNVTERGVVFATSANPTTTNNKVQMGTGTGVYSQSVTALTSNTTYHYRAYAINSVGTTYGIDSMFTTLQVASFNENLYNAFSPNGDGINDSWQIDNATDLNDHEIVVFNIFGQEVFHQTGYTTAWDGTKDGNPIPSGEYYYLIKGPKINTKGALLIKNK